MAGQDGGGPVGLAGDVDGVCRLTCELALACYPDVPRSHVDLPLNGLRSATLNSPEGGGAMMRGILIDW